MCSCDWPEFSSRRTMRSRKRRRCAECKQTIQPGDLYTHEAGKSDGEFYVIETCKACDDWFVDIHAEVDDPCCDMPPLGDMAAWRADPQNAEVVARIEAKRRAAV